MYIVYIYILYVCMCMCLMLQVRTTEKVQLKKINKYYWNNLNPFWEHDISDLNMFIKNIKEVFSEVLKEE